MGRRNRVSQCSGRSGQLLTADAARGFLLRIELRAANACLDNAHLRMLAKEEDMNITNLVDAHAPDIAWLITLWHTIHGGDPSPEEIVVDDTSLVLAATLAAHLAKINGAPALTIDSLEQGAERLGMQVVLPETSPLELFREQPPRQILSCVFVNGSWICIGGIGKLNPPVEFR